MKNISTIITKLIVVFTLGLLPFTISACIIDSLYVEPYTTCNADGTFDVDLEFFYDNVDSLGFDLFVNGNFHSFQTNYPNPFITVPNLAIGNGNPVTVTVSDNDNPNCAATYTFLAPNCNTIDTSCIINNLFVEPDTICNADGTFNVDLVLNYSGVTNTYFDVYVNNSLFNYYTYSSLNPHITIPAIAQADGGTVVVTVSDNDNPSCGASYTFIAPNCNTVDSCSITNLFVEPYPNCNADGTFDVDLEFAYSNVSGVGFDLFVNGNFHSFQTNYPNPFITVPNLAIGNGNPVTVTVSDNDNPNCGASYTFIAPNCSNTIDTTCIISNLFIEPDTICNADGTFNVDLAFNYSGVTNTYFDVYVNGTLFNYYTYSSVNPYLHIPSLAIANGAPVVVVVSDNDNPNCAAAYTFTAPSCVNSPTCTANASFEYSANMMICEWDTISFINNSTGANNYNWWVNGNNVSSGTNLDYVFTNAGTYTIGLDAIVDSLCNDEFVLTLVVASAADCVANNDSCMAFAAFQYESFAPYCEGDTVFFLNTSSGANQFNWWIDGDYVSNDEHLIYVFGNAGTYEIGLAAYDSNNPNCLSETSQLITIESAANCGNATPCQAEAFFETNAIVVCESDSVTFWNGSTGADTYNWWVNGNSMSTSNNLTYVFTSAGIYTIGLNASDSNIAGCDSEYVLTIEVQPSALCGTCTGDSCVWSGDANKNGQVNVWDLLKVGEAYGATGPARNAATTNWQAETCSDWNNTFGDGTNYKHSDTNGDGIVDANDALAIDLNYATQPSDESVTSTATTTLRLRPALIGTQVLPSGNVSAEIGIILENTTGNPVVEDIYGIAFGIDYNATANANVSNSVSYSSGTWYSWLGNENSTDIEERILTLTHQFTTSASQGRTEIGLTKINQTAIDGMGILCKMTYVADLNTIAKASTNISSLNINLNSITLVSTNGIVIPVQGGATTVSLNSNPPTVVKAKVLLEGAYNSSSNNMSTNLNTAGLLPSSQPFNALPWSYLSNQNVSNMPANAVDWVLLEVRDATNFNNVVEQKAALLLSNGEIVDVDGITNGVNFYTLLANQNYHLVVRHRSHLAVMSANSVNLPNASVYDFTNANNVMSGTSQLVAVNTGIYALISGDFDSNGIINVFDYNFYQENISQTNAYEDADANLDGVISIDDFNRYQPNATRIGVFPIRY